MNKIDINIIQQQEICNGNVNLSNAEVINLMSKYGINPNMPAPQEQPKFNDPNANLTFDEMVAIEESRLKAERQKREFERMQEMNKPTPYSFDRQNVRFHDTQYRTFDDENNFGMEIRVVTNMDINKGYGY